jgi:6-phosphogluconolactonase (cycloisomerase 2 family)
MNWNPRRFTFVFFAIFAGLVFSGCGGGNQAPRLTALTVAPTSASVVAGSTQQFTVTGPFGDGTTQDETASVTWTSSNSAVATIASGGVATGVAAGTANITANLFGVTSNAAVLTVTASSTLISIAVTPANPTIIAGGTQQFTATGTYQNASGPNTTQDITGQVTWASVTTAAATIDPSGLATGVANGASVITATLSGITGQTSLTVGTPIVVGLKFLPTNPTAATGTTVIFSVPQELLSDGTTQALPPGTTITWVSDTPVNASIPANSRVAQALGVGTAVISATESGTNCPGPAACTGSTTLTVVAAQARFAYLADANANSFDAYSVVATTGTFTPEASPAANQAVQVIVHPSGHFLYIIDGTSFVAVFDVNSTTGVAAQDLTIPTVPAGANGFAKGLVDRTGKFFFAISSNNGPSHTDAFYAYTINQTTGALTPVAGSPFTTNLNVPVDIQIAHQAGAANDYLYVINNGDTGTNSNTVAGFSINPTTGVPTALGTPTIATGSGPFFSTVDPSGTHLYVPNGNDNTVSEYSIAATGILTQVGTATAITDGTTPAGFVFNVAVDPTGKYLYVVDSPDLLAPGTVYGFNIGANGAIGTPVGPGVVTGDGPTGIAIDPTGVLVAVDDNGGNSISSYALGAGGVLTPYPDTPTGAAPQFITFYTAVAGQ